MEATLLGMSYLVNLKFMKYVITEQQEEKLIDAIQKYLDSHLTPNEGWESLKEYIKEYLNIYTLVLQLQLQLLAQTL